ncbi:MAG: alpha-2-macroglobulin, partial [Spirochaetales bacterium]|nr:alpha-2-macroglobulin [Spirochaetales bacterium]
MLRSKMPLLIIAALLMTAACSSRSSGADDRNGDTAGAIAEDRQTIPEENTLDLSMYQVKYFIPGETGAVDAGAGPTAAGGTAVYENDEPFTVTGYGPVDYLPAAVKRPSIFVTFSQPVVPLAQLGEPSGSSGILEIDPPLAGVYRWYGTRLLSFDADEDVIPQRQYTVRVSSSTHSLGGKPLEGDRDFTFRTEPLSIARIIPGDKPEVDLNEVPPDAAKNITVLFNHPVNPDVVSVYIDIMINGETVPFSFDRRFPAALEFTPELRERAIVLRLQAEVGEKTEIGIVLREGAKSEKNYSGSPAGQSLAFTTLGDFELYGHDTYSWSFPRSPEGVSFPVFLTFSHPVDVRGIEKRLQTQPKSDITADAVSVWENQVMISGLPFPPESTYTLVLDPEIKDMYGRSLGETVKLKIEVPEAQRYAYFPNTGARILEAEFPHRIVYEHQNVFDGVWKIDRIADPYRSFDPGQLEPYDFSGLEKNVRHFEVLDLDPWLNVDGKGAVGISWNFEELDRKGVRPTWGQWNLQLQVTDLAITTRVGYNRILVLVTSLSSGEPVYDAKVAVMRDRDVKLMAETDENGAAVFDLEPGDYNRYFQDYESTWKDHLRIRAEYGLDSVEFVPNGSHNPYSSGLYSVSGPLYAGRPRMETYVFTDRGLYRPGEKVWFKGTDLDLRYGEYSSYQGPFTAELKESGYDGKVIASLDGYTSTSGGFYGSFQLPAKLEPGYYPIVYRRPDEQTRSVYLQVAYFENLNFEVAITGSDTIRYLGDTLEFDVNAGYLAGGNLAGGSCVLYWTKEPAFFSPPGDRWEDYSFGPLGGDQRYFLSSRDEILDSTGTIHAGQQTTVEGIAGMPYSYQLEARVQDAGRQEIAARERVLVHPASFYVGGRISTDLQSAWSTFVAKGDELSVEWVLVGPDGNLYDRAPARRRIEAALYRVDWKIAQQQGVAGMVTTRYEMVEELEDSTEIEALRTEGSVSFTPSRAGLYRVRLSSRDEAGRAVVTELDFYATGADWIRWGGDSSIIDLQVDGELFAPGETANILVKSPLPEGRYIVTVEREGIFDEYLISLEGSAQVIGVPVREEHVPVVYVSVASYSVRAGEPSHTYFTPDLDKPKGYYGVVALPVDTSTFRIDLDIDTGGFTYLPGGKAEIAIRATKNGEPVAGAEVSFLAVDRGVVDLIDYHVPDPLDFFYSQSNFPLSVTGADSRSLLIDPVTYEVRDQYGGDSGDEKGEGETRSNFVPTAVFEPFLITDRDGVARAAFTLPDSLTTYRCTAVAAAGTSFGYVEEELRVQQPINVTSLLPKRIRVRDTVTAGVMITNMDRSIHDVTIGIESDLVKVDGEAEKIVAVGPGETVEVVFNLYSDLPGETEVAFVTRSKVLSERLVRTLIVEKPSVRETVTTAGRVEAQSPAAEGIVIPGGEAVSGGSIKIEVSPSLLSGLFPAVEYLLDYPHGCLEQRASRLMPVVLFGDAIVDDPG